MGIGTSRIKQNNTRNFIQQYVANASVGYKWYWGISLVILAAIIGMFSYIIWEIRDKDKNFFERKDRNGEKYNAWIAGVLLTLQVILFIVTGGYGYKILERMEIEDNYITDLVVRANLGNINRNMASSLQGLVKGRVGANINVATSNIIVRSITDDVPLLKEFSEGTGDFTSDLLQNLLDEIVINLGVNNGNYIDFSGRRGGAAVDIFNGNNPDLSDWTTNGTNRKNTKRVIAFSASVGTGTQDARRLEPPDTTINGVYLARSEINAEENALRTGITNRGTLEKFYQLIEELNRNGIVDRASFNARITPTSLGWTPRELRVNIGNEDLNISYYEFLAYNFDV